MKCLAPQAKQFAIFSAAAEKKNTIFSAAGEKISMLSAAGEKNAIYSAAGEKFGIFYFYLGIFFPQNRKNQIVI